MYIGTLNFLPTDYLYVGRISECSTTLFRIFEIARTSALVQQLVVFNARVLRSPTSLQNDVCVKHVYVRLLVQKFANVTGRRFLT